MESTDAPAVATCRVCGCTDENSCAGGCAWYAPGLCTVCALAVEAMYEWKTLAVNPDNAAFLKEVEALDKRMTELSEGESPIIIVAR